MRLPLNCIVEYHENFLDNDEASSLYTSLIEDYKLDQSRLIIEAGGKLIETDSFKILFSTEELIKQNIHPEHIHGKVYPWAGSMQKLKNRVESILDKEFGIAMCLYYPNGNYFAPYHFDQQTSGDKTILPSISLGEVREFCFKSNKNDEVFSLNLAHGSLIVMKDHCQSRYTHSLPKNEKYKKGRINITFRESSFK